MELWNGCCRHGSEREVIRGPIIRIRRVDKWADLIRLVDNTVRVFIRSLPVTPIVAVRAAVPEVAAVCVKRLDMIFITGLSCAVIVNERIVVDSGASAALDLCSNRNLGEKVIGAKFNLGSMRIEYFHASKFGNGAMVAEEFKKLMKSRGVTVNIHHIRDVRPKEPGLADLYVFSSPGRIGKPIGSMRRFLKKIMLLPGTRYAILTTEGAPRPDKKTGKMPTEQEMAKWQRVRPVMNEMLLAKGLKKVAEGHVLVGDIKGPLEEGWQKKVEEFSKAILESS